MHVKAALHPGFPEISARKPCGDERYRRTVQVQLPVFALANNWE